MYKPRAVPHQASPALQTFLENELYDISYIFDVLLQTRAGDKAFTNAASQSYHIFDPDYNRWDPDANQCVLLSAAVKDGQVNCLGVADAVPVRYTSNGGATDPTNIAIGWGPDTDYSGSIGISSIVGGYDNVVNAGASSIIGSYHSMIADGPELHNTIVGGTTCFVSGTMNGAASNTGRAGFFNSYNSSVLGGPYNTVLGSNGCHITAAYSGIINSTDCDINRGSENLILNSEDCTIDNTGAASPGRNNTIIGANDVTIDNDGVDAARGVALGLVNGHIGEHGATLAIGRDVDTIGGGVYSGIDKMAVQGDAQTVKWMARARTTDASNKTLDGIGIASGAAASLTLPVASSGMITARLVAMMDGSSGGNNDGNYNQVIYENTFGFMIDGTNTFLFDAAAESAVAAALITRAMTPIAQLNNTFTPANANVRLSTAGGLTFRVAGVAATIINWLGEFNILMTRSAT